VLKCDIKKFFASIDQSILLDILGRFVPDQEVLNLVRVVVASTSPQMGLPLGNLTSQLLVNVYMNEFDQFVKHAVGEKYYSAMPMIL
jgi:RNA-directed DNA polymerase